MMQKILLLLLLIAGAATVQAQSLKDMLYSGKLRSDSNTVVRKTDDLKAKLDTGQKKPAAPAEKVTAATPADSTKKVDGQTDSLLAGTNVKDSSVGSMETADSAKTEVAAVPVKSNTKIWKEYTDSLVATLKPEIDNAKKIKKETYYVLVAYEIDTSGKVNVANVGITPTNEVVHALVRQYLDVTPPQLSPVLDSANKPRKVKRSGSFTIIKN